MESSTLCTSVSTLGTDTIISTMLFSSPALMLADTAWSLVATVDRWASRLRHENTRERHRCTATTHRDAKNKIE